MPKVIHQKEVTKYFDVFFSYFNRSFTVPDRVSVNLTLRYLSCVMCTTCYSSLNFRWKKFIPL